MDHKQFTTKLSRQLGRDEHSTATITAALASIITEAGQEFDSLAVPGFGTLATVKTPEHVVDNGGTRTLMPPAITMQFQPSIVLRKKLSR